MKIWERHFVGELGKSFLLILVSFFVLYVMIDYSVHAKTFADLDWGHLARYYGWQFSHRASMLLPFALLIASIKVLTSLTVHNETVALLVSGIKKQRLLRPFLLFALLICSLLYLNYQYIYPSSATAIDTFQGAQFRQPVTPQLHALELADASSLYYQRLEAGHLHDVVWMEGRNTIWHMKTFEPASQLGSFVDHIVRLDDGTLQKEQSYDSFRFAKLKMSSELVPPDTLPLSALAQKLPTRAIKTDREAELVTAFCSKLFLPLICLLVILIPAPICLRFSRSMPIFLIYSLSIVGFLLFQMVTDAAVILGENHVFPPLIAVGAPFALLLGYSGWRHLAMR